MGKRYWACAAAIGGAALVGSMAFAADGQPDLPAAGYAELPSASPAAERSAVQTCFSSVQDKLDGRGIDAITLADVNRVWPGSEGFIVDLTVKVVRKEAARLRDFTCRQSRFGLQLARY